MTTLKVKGKIVLPDSPEAKEAKKVLSSAWLAHGQVTITVKGHTYPLQLSLVEEAEAA